MQIRYDQLAMFEQLQRKTWRARLAATIGKGCTPAFVASVEPQAAAYGIKASKPLAQYVALAFALGPDFHRLPRARAYLARKSIDDRTKMTALLAAMNNLRH
jgi:hypothetical protein